MVTNHFSGLCMAMAWLTLAIACSKSDPLGNSKGCIANGKAMNAALMTGENLPKGTLSLTFDGGPSAYTAEIGEYLWQNEIQAAFFVTGRQVVKHSEVLGRLKEVGHLVGNLSYNEASLLSSPDPVQAIRRTDELITPYVTGNMFLFRPPMGLFSDDLAKKIDRAGMSKYVGPIGWDVGTSHDPAPQRSLDLDCWASLQDADACATRYLEAIRTSTKGIVVFHDLHPDTLALVRKVVAAALSESFLFVRLDAIPRVKQMIDTNGGMFGKIGGEAACNDYH